MSICHLRVLLLHHCPCLGAVHRVFIFHILLSCASYLCIYVPILHVILCIAIFTVHAYVNGKMAH